MKNLLSYKLNFYLLIWAFLILKYHFWKIFCLSVEMLLPLHKNPQYFIGPLYFSKFDKCDVKSHLHKVTGRNLTGHFFNRPSTVAPYVLHTINDSIKNADCFELTLT